MDSPEIQSGIGSAMRSEVAQLETYIFGRPIGGWPATGLSGGQLDILAGIKTATGKIERTEKTEEIFQILERKGLGYLVGL